MGSLFREVNKMPGFLQTTKFKMFIAQFLYKFIRFLRISPDQLVERQGIRYELDLKEGIDLSIFLFGNFQNHIYQNISKHLSTNPVIFDVGANIGTVSLKMAKAFPDAKIYAFEPTHYAWKKFQRNLALNPLINKVIFPIQSFVGEKTSAHTQFKAFSSWPVNSLKENEKRHKIHLGEEKEAIPDQISIDDFVKVKKITDVNFIKIDTDGYEFDVLKGAINTLLTYKPLVIFEFSSYLIKEKNINIKEYFDFFRKLNYLLIDSKSSRKLSINNIFKLTPPRGSIDIFACPE